MYNSPQARGYGITKSDMEASRLVFVHLKDSKPRRKVAVPVPDHYTWEDFTQLVKTKLKLAAVGDVVLASSGQKVTTLDDLHDIDELVVEEAPAPRPLVSTPAASSEAGVRPGSSSGPPLEGTSSNGAASPVMYRQPSNIGDKHKIVMADSSDFEPGKSDDPSGDEKYVKRVGSTKRFLQRLFPGWNQPGLPTSTKELGDDKQADGRGTTRRRRRRPVLNARSILLALAMGSCMATMVILYLRVSI